MTKEEIYDRMILRYVVPDDRVEYEFEVGKPCMDLYAKVCDARLRLEGRAGIDFEDRDVLEIISCMEDIARICALKMFDYGARYGRA